MKDVPPNRYMTDYGVLAQFTKPPYTTLTAYDLNTGEIKWQVPNGDHSRRFVPAVRQTPAASARAMASSSPRAASCSTPADDGKVRAYDEDTRRSVVDRHFHGTTSGVPVSYESKGRQYFVIVSNEGGGGRGGEAPRRPRKAILPHQPARSRTPYRKKTKQPVVTNQRREPRASAGRRCGWGPAK